MPGAATLDDVLAPLLADVTRSAVLLDVDGTLAPIVRHADDAHVPEPTRAPLIRIAKRYGLVACVSGRRAATARRIVSLGSINYVGNHGAELLRGGTTVPELDREVAAWSGRIHRFYESALERDDLRKLRVRGEDKEAIVAFHWRGAPDEDAAEEAAQSVAAAAQAAGLRVHWGRKVLEVRPPVEINKGRGIDRLLREVDVDAALYAGDDRTDLDGFRTLRAAVADGRLVQAVCVAVRSDETPAELEAEADIVVDGPQGVRRMLETLAAG